MPSEPQTNNTENDSQAGGHFPRCSPFCCTNPGGAVFYENEDKINLLDLWHVITKRWYLICLTTFLSTVIAIYIAITTSPVYTAKALLFVNSQEKQSGLSAMASQFGGLANLAGINLGTGGGSLEKSIAIMSSRKFTSEFIKDEKLMPILLEWKWDELTEEWEVPIGKKVPGSFFGKLKKKLLSEEAIQVAGKNTQSQKDINNSVEKWLDNLEVQKNTKNGLVGVSISWKNPYQAATWVNLVVKRMNSIMKRRAVDESIKNISYLNQQLEATSLVDIKQLFYNIIEEQTKNMMIAEVRDDFVFQVIDPAIPPEKRSKPQRTKIVMMGALVGLICGVLFVFFLLFVENQKAQMSKNNFSKANLSKPT